MNYNEIIKIKGLMNNIKSNFVENLLYYNILYEFKSSKHNLPNDLINNITNLNDIDRKIGKKTKVIMSKLNEEINNFINDLKDDIIDKYISDIKEASIKSSFNDNIKSEINEYLNNITRKDFEKNYYLILEKSINENVKKVYSQKLNEYTNEIINIILDNKNTLKQKIPKNGNEDNNELENINKALVNVHELIDNYMINYNYSFKISDEFIRKMDEFYNAKFSESLNNLNNIIEEKKNNLKNKVFDKYTNIIKELKIENFNNNYNHIMSKIESFIDNIKIKINKYSNDLSTLKEKNDNINIKDNEIEQKKEENSIFTDLISSSSRNKIYISNYIDFQKEIDDYIKKLNSSFEYSLSFIKYKSFEEEIKSYINELYNKYLDYYNKINQIYNITNITQSIIKIDDLLNENFNKEQSYLNCLNNKIEKEEELKLKNTDIEKLKVNETLSFIIPTFKKYYHIKIKLINNNENSFNITLDNDDNYNPKINVNLLNKEIKFNNMTICIEEPSGLYEIYINLDFNGNMIKYNIKIDSNYTEDNDPKVRNYEKNIINEFNILK